MSKQINFNLDEESEIQFKLSVKGSANLPNVKPVMRFIISENSENGIAVVLPAHSTEEGVKVTIPSLKQVFSEEKEYIGKLEIIVGNRYFAPTSMNIGFTKTFDIQAEAIIKENSSQFNVGNIKTSKSTQKQKTVTENKHSLDTKNSVEETELENSSVDDLPDDFFDSLELKEEVKKPIVSIQSPLPKSTQKPMPAKTKTAIVQDPTKTKKDEEFKKELKALLKGGLK